MPRPRARRPVDTRPARRARDRHGRGARGPITGPELPSPSTRIDLFEAAVALVADQLRGVLGDELDGVGFEVAAAPPGALGDRQVERWRVDRGRRRITLFRVPIQRLAKLHRDDETHRRLYVEGCVVRAVAEYTGRDPWDIAPDGYGHW